MTAPKQLHELEFEIDRGGPGDPGTGKSFAVVGDHVIWDNGNGTYDVWPATGSDETWNSLDPITAAAVVLHLQGAPGEPEATP
jgi:hypothetical protein